MVGHGYVNPELGTLIKVQEPVKSPIAGRRTSNLAVIGRYLPVANVAENLKPLKSGLGAAEIQLKMPSRRS